MINYVIIESKKYQLDLITRIIKKFYFTKDNIYNIYDFKDYNYKTIDAISKIKGKIIYIININAKTKSNKLIAQEIRKQYNYKNPVLFTCENIEEVDIKDIKDIIFCNIIEYGDNFINNFYESIKDIYRYLSEYNSLRFRAYDEVFRIPYDEIYYIIKNNKDDSVTIYTKDNTITRYISIVKLSRVLESCPRFYRTKSNCIVNILNISSYDKITNTIYFNNGLSTNQISQRAKKGLEYRITSEYVE